MTVINPCDYNQTKAAVQAIADYHGPVYLRFGRPSWPIFIPEDQEFVIGKALHLNEGADVSIFATGHLVWNAVEAARELEAEGVSVDLINIHTIKPLDEAAVIASAKKTGAVVSCEEHNKYGGLGSAIAECLSKNAPTFQEYVATDDTFGESGKAEELLEKYGLGVKDIVAAAKRAIAKK
jgi:transketolase